jgi:DNA-binding Lrp family transcriptional regulator
MDDIDKLILNKIQAEFPIAERPFQELGKELGLTEVEVLERIKNLKEEGIIRRIGASFDSKKLGFKSTLCAIKVPEERVDEVAEIINQYPEVTHNYLRNHAYNIWFTLITPSREHIHKILGEISQKSGIGDVREMPSTRVFKIGVNLRFKGANNA